MKRMNRWFLMLLAMIVTGWCGALSAADKPARILSVTGLESRHHDWRDRSLAIREVLEADPQLTVHVTEDPELLASPTLAKYDALIMHFRNLEPLSHAEPVQANLARYVHDGGGLVLVHGVLGAFPDWSEYVGIAGRIWGPKTAHDARGPFPVSISDREHSVTRGLDPFTADDELFSGLVGETPVQVLATAHSKLTRQDVPVAYVLQYGNGRVFSTTLGHDARAIRMPGTTQLLRRGCLWAAGREPAPADPGNK